MTGYEWLDDPSNAEFNFLYLSKNMHTSFDGTDHGGAPSDAAQPAICIEPGIVFRPDAVNDDLSFASSGTVKVSSST